MTDLQKTVAYLDDMGYNRLRYLPVGYKAGLRNYHVDRLFIRADQSSFTFNKDESLAGIGYGPPTRWDEEYIKTGQEAKNMYEEDYDAFFINEQEEFYDDDDERTSWDDAQIPDEEDDE